MKKNRVIEALKSEARKEARSDLAALCEVEEIYRKGGSITPEELMRFAVRQSQRVEVLAGSSPLLRDALGAVEEIRELIMTRRARSVQ
jgi:hypothetical protein